MKIQHDTEDDSAANTMLIDDILRSIDADGVVANVELWTMYTVNLFKTEFVELSIPETKNVQQFSNI